MNTELAYEIIGSYLVNSIGCKTWDKLILEAEIFDSSTSNTCWRIIGSEKDQGNQIDVSFDVSRNLSKALKFLKSNIKDTTGETIWGLEFTLYPDSKFNITYSYEMPESYKEALKDFE